MSLASRRDDVYWVNLDPVVGTKIRKTRPAVVVSNNSVDFGFLNRGSGRTADFSPVTSG